MTGTPCDDRARLVALLHALPLAAVLVDVDDRVVGANERFVRLFHLAGRVDLTPGAPLGPIHDAVAELYAPPYRERYARPHAEPEAPAAPAAPAGPAGSEPAADPPRPLHRAADIPLADGRTIRRRLEPIRQQGRVLGTLWTAQDITANKRAERDLERDNRALSELIRHRSAFAAAASHELRTPLAAILSFCELLADPASGELTGEQREFLAAVRRNAERMHAQIRDLFAATTSSSAQLQMEYGWVRVPQLLERAVLDRSAALAEAAVFTSLTCADGPELWADEHRLHAVLANLLENAAKFTPRGGSVSLTAGPGPTGWRIEVADTGIGVPAAYREEVFTGFVRAPNALHGGYPGTGIGLAVSRDVVRLHGGTLTVSGQEQEGTGAVFAIHLPYAGPPGIGHPTGGPPGAVAAETARGGAA
ncbi:HAMP domain-containing sensor histidine kinase [Streptomyces sp. HSW2009]|uniref:sensor histidine kinase n=1 Tax=Streptomyces sp. HSW2009 TaxID=3142890 RepID=UPI0032F096B0